VKAHAAALDSPSLASAAHHGQGAPSARRMPTEASADETFDEPWSREAAFASEGAGGEPRSGGEGAKPTGAGSGAEPRVARDGTTVRAPFEARSGPPSYLDTYEVTRLRRGRCAWRMR